MATNIDSEASSDPATSLYPATSSDPESSDPATDPATTSEPVKSSDPVTLPLPISHHGIPPAIPKPFHVLLGVTGSVASLKLPLLISKLLEIPEVEVRVVSTEHAKHFYSVEDILVPLYSDSDEWQTCVVRAWDLKKPLLFCPAMNTAMWEHPATQPHVDQLKSFGYTEVPCIVKKLMCGDEGRGAMAEVETIVEKVRMLLPEGNGKNTEVTVET